jgi:hypothetical protein
MNTNLITARSTIRATAFAACLGLLFAGATACGTEHAATPAKTGNRPASLSSIDLIEKAKANQQSRLQQLKAQGSHPSRPSAGFGDDRRSHPSPSSAGFGDDRRQQQAQTAHAPGYNKALLSER